MTATQLQWQQANPLYGPGKCPGRRPSCAATNNVDGVRREHR